MNRTAFPPEEFFVSEDIADARSLPARAFTDRAFLRLELDTVFTRSWLLIPEASGPDGGPSLAGALKIRGARAAFSLLGRPLFLQRDWNSKLHCFPNVCTHAWYPLVEGRSRSKTIVCSQHGRSFDCAGKFQSQAGFGKGEIKDFPAADDHLRDLPVGQWDRFLFVCLGEPAEPLAELLRPLRASTARLPLHDFKRAPGVREAREVEGNWKQHACNYMDKYHITFIHRAPGGLADAIDLASYKTELHDRSALQWAYARDPEHGFDPEHLPGRFRDPKAPQRRVFALWWFLFPNLTLNFYPWGLSVNIYQPLRDAPERTQFIWHHYVWNPKKYARRAELWLDQQVDDEDVHAMALVRPGAASGFAPRGRFSPAEEAGPHWFHRLVHQAALAA